MYAKSIRSFVLVAILAGLALAGLSAIPGHAATPPFLLKWGTFGLGNGEFNNPAGVAVSGTTVYVADSYNHRIQRFTVASGTVTFVTSWGTAGVTGTANGQFNAPSAIAVDGYGNFYVADTNNHRIQEFDSAGNYYTQWGTQGAGNGQFDGPSGIAISGTLVYVADSKNNRIQVFDRLGNFKSTWGVSGAGPGQFNNPAGIALDSDGYVYVADSDNNRIQKFSSGGVFSMTWGMTGTLTAQFIRPTGIAVDGSYVYVVDSGNNRVQVFDHAGVFKAAWGAFGAGDGEFMLVSGIAVDHVGNMFVADTGNNRIQEFGQLPPAAFVPVPSSLTFIREITGTVPHAFNAPRDLALDNSGNLYVVDSGNNRIQKYDSNGNFIVTWGTTNTVYPGKPGEFNGPSSIAISGTNVYIADRGNDRVQVFDLTGGFVTSWTVTSPAGVAVDKTGNVYVASNRYGFVYKYDSTGGLLTSWGGYGGGDGQFYSADDIAINTAGQVFVLDAGSNNPRVQQFTSAGGLVAKFGGTGTGNGQFIAPTSLAIDRGGNTYVADAGNVDLVGRLQQFSSDNGYLTTITGTLLATPGRFGHPGGVAVTPDGGAVYVSDTSHDRLLKFGLTAPSDYVNSFGEYGAGDGQFNRPGGIAVDDALSALDAGIFGPVATNYVYVADTLNGRVQKFTTQGVYVGKWSSWSLPTFPYYDQFLAPGGVAYSAVNNLVYVADTFANRIVYFDPGGNYKGTWGTKGASLYQFDHPIGVAVDNYGYVYVADAGNDRVEKYSWDGKLRFRSFSAIAGLQPPLKRPASVAVDSAYYIYISDTGNHRIVKLDPSGNLVKTWGSLGSGNTQFNSPVGITIGSGFVTIADTGNSRLMKYTSDGVFIAKVGTLGSAPGQFNNVTGVTYDGHGNLYATDTNNHKVSIYNGVYLIWMPIVKR